MIRYSSRTSSRLRHRSDSGRASRACTAGDDLRDIRRVTIGTRTRGSEGLLTDCWWHHRRKRSRLACTASRRAETVANLRLAWLLPSHCSIPVQHGGESTTAVAGADDGSTWHSRVATDGQALRGLVPVAGIAPILRDAMLCMHIYV